MRAIAAAIGWERSPSDAAALWGRLADLSRSIGITGAWATSSLGFGRVGGVGDRRGQRSPALGIAAARGKLVATDCRLVARRALAEALGHEEAATDLDLVLSAHAKWGADLAAHLAGDFSIILHDGARNEVLLAAGGSGSRQLYFRRVAGGVLIASHPVLLQASAPLRRSDVDARTVRDYLVGRFRDPRRTFFSDVVRVPPGQHVILGAASTEWRRHFLPPVVGQGPRDERTVADCLAEFRQVFEACVADAVDPGEHHGVHLSGGLDSSSIAMTLPRIEARGATFELLTGVFPTLRSCDEAATVAAVANRLPFRARSWDAERAPSLEGEDALWPWPYGVVPTAFANYDDLEMAARAGAVAVLGGDGGDGLAMETAVFRDLARHGQWRLLWDELASVHLFGYARRYLLRQVVRDVLGRATGRGLPRSTEAPPWFGAALVAREVAEDVPESNHADRLPDLVQRQVWDAMTDPTDMWVVEGMNLRAFRAGLELRSPYRDTRLVSFVAAIPYDRRVCGGTLRRLQREGLADRLPPSVVSRIKVDFSPAVRALALAEWRAVKPMIDARAWCAEPYVPKAELERMVERAFGDQSADFHAWNLVRRIWTLELWLRRQAV